MGSSAAGGMGGVGGLPRDGAGAGPPPGNVGAQGRGRAFGPGPAPRVGLAAIAMLALVTGVLAAGAGGAASSSHHTATRSAAKYGGLPSWLPEAKVPVRRLLQASPDHPVLSIQGETVALSLARAGGRPATGAGSSSREHRQGVRAADPDVHMLATAVGPEVPEEGRFPVPPVSPCTFLVTFTSITGPVALNAAQFTLIDEQGHLHHPKLTARGGGPPPRELVPGRALTVALHDILPTGDGGLSWTPHAGARPLVTWDYTVEID